MKTRFLKAALLGFCAASLLSASALAAGSAAVRLRQATKATAAMIDSKAAPDIAGSLRDAKAVLIIPHLNKAGFVVGGQYGEGVLLRRMGNQWYGPAFFSITGASVGLQIGMASSMVIMTVNTDEGLKAFKKDGFKLGADVSAAAGSGGRSASAAASNHGGAAVYTYAITNGGFAGVALDGSVINALPEYNRQYWGRTTAAAKAMEHRANGRAVQPLIRKLDSLMRQ